MTCVLPPLLWKRSPNQSLRDKGVKVDLIVVHDTEGGYDGAVSWFANSHSEVSAHIVLREDGGEATQMVAYGRKAWHASDFNSRSIGLEMAGFAKKGYGKAEWAVAARIVAFLLHEHGLPARWAKKGSGPGVLSPLRPRRSGRRPQRPDDQRCRLGDVRTSSPGRAQARRIPTRMGQTMKSPYWLDAAERVAWTAAEAGAGALIDVLQSGTVTWRAALYAVGLAVLKVIAARKVGNPTSAAIKP